MDGDQLVIYQALAAFAQIAIVLMAIFAVKGFLGVLDRFGVLANRAGKGLIDRASKKGQEIKGNSAWQRGKDTRKRSKQALKDERYARSPIRRRIAGGFMPTEAGRHARQAVQRNAEHTVRQHEAEEANIIAEQLRRSGNTGDTHLEEIARGQHAEGHSAAGRRAAMNLLAENGRVAALRRLQQTITNPDDQESFREVVTGHGGRLYGKAPDLNPGNPDPFQGASAADASSWHHSTLNEAFNSAHRNAVRQAFDEAWNNPNLRGNITPDALNAYQTAFGVQPPTIAPPNPAGGAAGAGTPAGGGGGPGVLNVPHAPAGGGGGAAQPGIVVPPGVANPNPGNAAAAQPVQQQRAAGGNFAAGPGANTPPPPPPPGGGTPPPAGP